MSNRIVPRPWGFTRGFAHLLSSRRYSDYFITINTNYRPISDEDAEDKMRRLEAACNVVMGDVRAVSSFMIRRPDAPRYGRIQAVDRLVRGEVGTRNRGGRVHAHVTLAIDHDSRLTTTTESGRRLKQLLYGTGLLDFARNLHINFKLVKSWAEANRHYVTKDNPYRRPVSMSAKERIDQIGKFHDEFAPNDVEILDIDPSVDLNAV